MKPRRVAARSSGTSSRLSSKRSSNLTSPLWSVLLALPLMAWPLLGAAQALHQYPDADLDLGQKLLTEHHCAACHVRHVGGDGSAIYRPAGRINTPSALVTMVERCSTELNLQLFPEDTVSIAAVLQRDHYRFRAAAAAQKP